MEIQRVLFSRLRSYSRRTQCPLRRQRRGQVRAAALEVERAFCLTNLAADFMTQFLESVPF